MSYFRSGFAMALATGAMTAASSRALAVSYASNVTKAGTTVNFILNSPADVLSYSINGGAPIMLDGSTKGAKTFSLTSASDTFSIVAQRNDAIGFAIPTGNVLPAENSTTTGEPTNGLTQPSNEGGLNIISDEAALLTRFNSPRGLDVSKNPNSSNFGTAYIANSAATTTTPAYGRNLTDGLYAIRADQSDAFGYGDTAQNPNNVSDGLPAFNTTTSGNSSPFRIFVKDDGDVYVADYSDINGQAFKITPNLSAAQNLFEGFGGPAPVGTTPDGTGLPAGQNHGSFSSLYVEGSLANNNLVVYGVDEDLNSAHFTEGAAQNDRNSLWRWDVGGTVPSNVTPTKIAGGLIGDFPAGGITVDMTRGGDGKFYLSQARSTTTGASVGLIVTDAAGAPLFNSLEKSREILSDPAARDILTWTMGITVSSDQKWLATMVNSSDVCIIPLIDGIPDLANRLLVDSGAPTGENSGRDIAFDAAGNLHYVSSGQARYRVLAPGGQSVATTTWNGTEFVFDVQTNIGGGLDGDFNDDDVVDGADFLVWQRGGSPNPLSAGDLDLWKANFGESAAVSAVGAVPEPTSLGLALIATSACLATARLRTKRG